MREILFRGKSERVGWVYGYYWSNELGNHFIRRTVDNRKNICVEDVEVMQETISQYTGLCDKNGKKVFAGDIVKIHFGEDFAEDSISVVEWGNFAWNIRENGFHSGDFISEFNMNTVEVIGNILDNPELLKV